MPADLVIVQRNCIIEGAHNAMKYWQALGKPVVIDLDDHYGQLPFSNPARRFWMTHPIPGPNGDEYAGAALDMLQEGLRISNGLISPNRKLLDDWAYCSGNSYYLQNYCENLWWSDLPEREEVKARLGLTGRTVIGWGGSISHLDSWHMSGIMQAASRIARQFPEVVFLLCGNDDRLYHQLDVPSINKQMQPGVPPQDWPKIVRSFDIGIAPLFGPYDQRRSWIKGIEYMLAGCPWVATEGEPYRDIAQFGIVGPETEDFWVTSLVNVLQDLPARRAFYESKRQWALETFSADYRTDAFEAVFKKIISDFAGGVYRLPGVFKTKGFYEQPETAPEATPEPA